MCKGLDEPEKIKSIEGHYIYLGRRKQQNKRIRL